MKVIYTMRDSNGSHANQALRRLMAYLPGEEQLRTRSVPKGTELVVQWGFKPTRALVSAMQEGIPYVIVDLGYFDHDRYGTFSISINGFHGTSMSTVDLSNRKPRPVLDIRDWQPEGDKVIVLGQMPLDQSLRGQDIDAWMGRAASEAVEVFKLPVQKRPHPKMLNPWEPRMPALENTFEGTHCYISWTSTAAIQTIAAGIPTVCQHPGSMCTKVSTSRIDRVRVPGRHHWMQDLSNRQYGFNSEAELKACAEHIRIQYDAAKYGAEQGCLDTEGFL